VPIFSWTAAFPWLRPYITSLSPTRSGFELRLDHERFVIGKAAVGQVSCGYLGVPMLVSIHQCSIIIHSPITDTVVTTAIEASLNSTYCTWIGSVLRTSVVLLCLIF